GDSLDAAGLDARRLHRQEEEREPLVLRRLRVAPRDENRPVGPMRARGPDLLAVDHPLIALARRPRAQTGQVGAGGGLREQLTPHLVTAERGRRVATLLLLRPVGEEGGHAHAEADLEVPARHQVARLLLRVDHLVDRRQRAPAPFGRPGQRGESGFGLLLLERLGPLEPVPALASGVTALPRLEPALLRLGRLREPGTRL